METTLSTKQTKEQAIETLTALLNDFKDRVDATAHEGSLIGHVYYLCGGSDHRDDLYCFNQGSIGLLSALAKPNISKKIQKVVGDHYYDYLVTLISNIVKFTEQMDTDRFSAELVLHELKEYPDSISNHTLEFLIENYSTKFKGLRNPKL